MGIFENLRMENASVRQLLDELIEQTIADEAETETPSKRPGKTPDGSWTRLLHDLKSKYVAQARAKESVFYDVLRNIPHRSEMADIKTEEHHLAEETIEDLEKIGPSDHDWSLKLSVLKNLIESEIAEEETTVFPIAESAVDDEMSERLSHEYEKARADVASHI